MANYTPNYNLKKPEDSDSYDIADANGNMDIIDGALNTLNNQIATKSANLANNFNLVRFGNVVFASCVGGTYNKDSSGHMTTGGTTISIPSGYKPQYNAELWDVLNSLRITATTAGYFDLSVTANTNCRFSGCWMTNDAMPT